MIFELYPPQMKNGKNEIFKGDFEYQTCPEMGDSFQIHAGTDRGTVKGGVNGLLYARDLIEDIRFKHNGVPCAEYSDSPDLKFRCYHIDLKKGSGGLQDIKRTLERLRHLRYNAVLIEYENRIRLDSLPGAAAPDAFSHDEVREIVRCAEENGFQVIPLLQSLGHLEYLLNLPAYRKYSESQTDFSQFCPLNDAAFELWKKAFDEIRALHPNSKYFHIGGDETRQLGKCTRCADYAEKHSQEELFFQHIDRVCRYTVEKGCAPVLWHDVLARKARFDLLAKLPPETILLYWEYNSREDNISWIMFGEHVLVSRDWIGKVHSFRDFTNAPKQFAGFIEDEAENFPDSCRTPGILPLMEPMKKTGHSIIGASSLGYAPCGGLLSNSDRLHSNMRMWLDRGIEGMVATRWASNDSIDAARGPASLRDFPLVMAAIMMWDTKTERREIEKRYGHSFGTGTEKLADYMDMMAYSEQEIYFNWAEHLAPEFAAMEKGVDPRMRWLFRKYRIAMNAELFLRLYRSFLRNFSGRLAGNEFGKKLCAQLPKIKQEIREDQTGDPGRVFR